MILFIPIMSLVIPIIAKKYFNGIQIAAAIVWICMIIYPPWGVHLYESQGITLVIIIPWIFGSLIALHSKIEKRDKESNYMDMKF